MPLPRKGTGVIPIFYFILASHDEKSFELCLHQFYNDAKKIRDQTPCYQNQTVSPYQCITDMSLVIFRPCLGKQNMKKKNNLTSKKKGFLTASCFFSFHFSSYQICYPFNPHFFLKLITYIYSQKYSIKAQVCIHIKKPSQSDYVEEYMRKNFPIAT